MEMEIQPAVEKHECFNCCASVDDLDDMDWCRKCGKGICDTCCRDDHAVMCACPPRLIECIVCGRTAHYKHYETFHDECMECERQACLTCLDVCQCDINETLTEMQGMI